MVVVTKFFLTFPAYRVLTAMERESGILLPRNSYQATFGSAESAQAELDCMIRNYPERDYSTWTVEAREVKLLDNPISFQ